MAQRIAVMNAGGIVQEGTPRELYARPRDAFMARFLGAANVLRGRIAAQGGGRATVRLEAGQGISVATDIPAGSAVELEVEGELAVGEKVAAVGVGADAAAGAVLGAGLAVPAPEPFARPTAAALDEAAHEASDSAAVFEVWQRERGLRKVSARIYPFR